MLVKRLGVGDESLARQAINTLKTETPLDVRENLDVEYLEDFLRCDNNYLLVALVEEEPVGFILAYRLMRVDREQDMMLFYEVVVDEKHRHQGVGRELILKLKQICRVESIMKMWVSTNKSNTSAVALYKSTGGIEDRHGDELSFTYLPPYEQTA
jgi:ribosomal protein S18 acetylase RimI-like enzyme